jgi:hypothetical protein
MHIKSLIEQIECTISVYKNRMTVEKHTKTVIEKLESLLKVLDDVPEKTSSSMNNILF